MAEANPPSAVRTFFSALADNDRAWLVLSCSLQIDREFRAIKSPTEADAWLDELLADSKKPLRQFGRLIHLIAIVDFELSPFALSRAEVDARSMMQSADEFVSSRGRRKLHELIPALKEMVDSWKDVRMHELDEASLWVYRDDMLRRDTEETRKQISQFRL
jgi:hypothetical protein